jgi:hypothetical protein
MKFHERSKRQFKAGFFDGRAIYQQKNRREDGKYYRYTDRDDGVEIGPGSRKARNNTIRRSGKGIGESHSEITRTAKEVKTVLYVVERAEKLEPGVTDPADIVRKKYTSTTSPFEADLAHMIIESLDQGKGRRLFDLRKEIDADWDSVDKQLTELAKAEKIVLYPQDDPQRLTDKDRAASIVFGGEAQHIVYLR